MFTKEQLAKWRSEGFVFDNFYDEVAVEKKENVTTNYSISGYWSSDPQGKKKIGRANLEYTVYYHVNTVNIPDGTVITLKLFEDTPFDDDVEKFPKSHVKKYVTIKKNKASLTLKLESSWDSVLQEDPGASMELDWKAYHKKYFPDWEELGAMLDVFPSPREIFIVAPIQSYNLPEFLTSAGQTIIFAIGDALEVTDKVAEKLDDCRLFIGARILKRGKVISNIGELYQLKQNIYTYNVYTNDGKKILTLEKASNFGFQNRYVNNGQVVTTKGLSQIDYFSNKGVVNGILKMGKELLNLLPVIDVMKSVMDRGYGAPPVPEPWAFADAIITNLIIKPQVEEIMEEFRDEIYQHFQIVKQSGLQKCMNFIASSAGQIGNYQYRYVSTGCIPKLVKGDFFTFTELEQYEAKLTATQRGDLNTIIYRTIGEKFYIECIFVNDDLLVQ